MQPKTVLFFSCEPGGAEVLIPVIRLLQEKTAYKVVVMGYGLGAERFSRKGIEYLAIDPVARGNRTLFDAYRPDLLITSATSAPEHDMTEKHLWRTARQLGVPSLAFVDQWQNYVIRFSGTAPHERLAYLPDYINCIDEIGKQEMTALDFAPETLLALGQPYLSGIGEDFEKVDAEEVMSRLGLLPGSKLALFVSEPILEYYGRTRGYDQYQAFTMFLEAMKDGAAGYRPVLKLHPKDHAGKFEEIIRAYQQLAPLVVGNQLNSLECLKIADLIVGMTSIMLIEGFVLGKAVMSLQPGLQIEDPLILSRHGFIPVATSPLDIKREAGTRTEVCNIDYAFNQDVFLRFLWEALH
jgi:hypothetical protein